MSEDIPDYYPDTDHKYKNRQKSQPFTCYHYKSPKSSSFLYTRRLITMIHQVINATVSKVADRNKPSKSRQPVLNAHGRLPPWYNPALTSTVSYQRILSYDRYYVKIQKQKLLTTVVGATNISCTSNYLPFKELNT